MNDNPSTPMALIASTAIIPNWRWRDRNGELYTPVEMETKHLFHVMRMIWNHAVDRDMRVGLRVQYYTFQPRFYPKAYMAEAIVHCWHELCKRTDLTPQWQREIDEMRGHILRRMHGALGAPEVAGE